MLSGVSDNPDKPKKYCSFRWKEPKQDLYGGKKKKKEEVWEPDASSEGGRRSLRLPAGNILMFLLDPKLLFQVAFVLAVSPTGSSAEVKVCRKITPWGTWCRWL